MGRGGQRESRCGAKEVGGNAEMLGDEHFETLSHYISRNDVSVTLLKTTHIAK